VRAKQCSWYARSPVPPSRPHSPTATAPLCFDGAGELIGEVCGNLATIEVGNDLGWIPSATRRTGDVRKLAQRLPGEWRSAGTTIR
jgi:hypothetical protein